MKDKYYRHLPTLLLIIAAYLFTTPACTQPAEKTTEQSAVVFMYHHFDVEQYPTTNISREQFVAQLDYLAQNGYQVMALDDILEHLRHGKPLPEKTVALTVDDAYSSVYTTTWPLLRQRGWPFTVFVSTDAIDTGFSAYMTWAQMREMQQTGVSFANHSRRHDHLIRHHEAEDDTGWSIRVSGDIAYARQRLEQELGKTPALFAYPYGEYSPALKRIVKKLGYTAFGQHSGAITINEHTDLQQLPRYPMAGQYASMDDFKLKAASLPLPVISASPDNPVTTDRQPRLTITLDGTQIKSIQKQQLRCYVSGQGETAITWLTENQFSLIASTPLRPGRSRYNCTMPVERAGQALRYYWFSHLWIVAAE